MTVILANDQFNDYYNMTPGRQGVVATIPWATTGLAQLCVGGVLAAWLGRLWALRISIVFMCLGVSVFPDCHRSRRSLTLSQRCAGDSQHLRRSRRRASHDWTRLRMCIHCIQPLRCRVCPETLARELRRHCLSVWIPAWHSSRLLVWLWNVLPHFPEQHRMACIERDSNPHWIDVCCDLIPLSRKVSSCRINRRTRNANSILAVLDGFLRSTQSSPKKLWTSSRRSDLVHPPMRES